LVIVEHPSRDDQRKRTRNDGRDHGFDDDNFSDVGQRDGVDRADGFQLADFDLRDAATGWGFPAGATGREVGDWDCVDVDTGLQRHGDVQLHDVFADDHLRARSSVGDADAGRPDGCGDSAEHLLQRNDYRGVGTASRRVRRRAGVAVTEPGAWRLRVDVPAEPAVGAVVCSSRIDGDWGSCVQQPAERSERSNAAGELFGDV